MLAAVALALALPVVAAAHPPPPGFSPTAPGSVPPAKVLSFTTFASGFVQAHFLEYHTPSIRRYYTPSNRIYIARAQRQALRWDKWLMPTAGSPASRDNDFSDQALVGVFLLGRYHAAKVTVTNLWLSGETLELSIKVVPFPMLVCVAPPGSGCPMPSIPPRTSFAYTLAAVSQAAIANVRRVVVTDEVDDAPGVIYIYPSPPSPPLVVGQ
jgi:hypothetical protein